METPIGKVKYLDETLQQTLNKYNILGKDNDATKDDARHGNEKRSSMVKKNETEEVDEQYSWFFGFWMSRWILENRRHDQEYHSISFSSANCVLLYLTKKKILIDAEKRSVLTNAK